MKRGMLIVGKGALLAAALWFGLAAGTGWASTHGESPAAPAEAQSMVQEHGAPVDAHGAAVEGAAGEHAVPNSLSPAKLKDLGWRVMNFIALMLILVKFAAKPLGSALSGRRRQIGEEIRDLEEKKAAAERSYQEFSAKLASVEKEIGTIVDKAVAQAEIEKAKILERAEKAAEDIQRQAKMVIANEVTAAKRALKNEVADQAALLAEEIVKKNLTPTDQVKIVEDYLDRVGAVQ